jgi:hypothetical protein
MMTAKQYRMTRTICRLVLVAIAAMSIGAVAHGAEVGDEVELLHVIKCPNSGTATGILLYRVAGTPWQMIEQVRARYRCQRAEDDDGFLVIKDKMFSEPPGSVRPVTAVMYRLCSVNDESACWWLATLTHENPFKQVRRP